MAQNRWLATGNFFTSHKQEQRIFFTHLDRLIFLCFLVLLFVWPLFFKLGNKNMLVIDNILVAIVAIYGLNLVTGYAGLISIGHAAFVGVGAYTLATFARLLGDSHVLLTHAWPLMILICGAVGAAVGAFVGLPALRLKHLYLVIATLSFQMIFQWVINFSTFFNQGQTIAIGRVFWFAGKVTRSQHYLFWYYIALIFVIIFGFAVRNFADEGIEAVFGTEVDCLRAVFDAACFPSCFHRATLGFGLTQPAVFSITSPFPRWITAFHSSLSSVLTPPNRQLLSKLIWKDSSYDVK